VGNWERGGGKHFAGLDIDGWDLDPAGGTHWWGFPGGLGFSHIVDG